MKKPINKIGFTFSWETPQTIEPPQSIGTIVESDKPSAFNELANRLDNLKNIMVSSSYAKMKKEQRIGIINTYDFYLSLYTEHVLTH